MEEQKQNEQQQQEGNQPGQVYDNQGNQGQQQGNQGQNQGNQGQQQGNQGQGNAYGQQQQQQDQPPPYQQQQQQQQQPYQQQQQPYQQQQQPPPPQQNTTVVVVQQPAGQQQQQQEPIREQPAHEIVHKNQYGLIDFQQGLFGCFNNCHLCILTLLCPCYVNGKIAESVGEHCLIYGIAAVVPIMNWYFMADARGKVRNLKGIKGSFTQDYIYVIFCPCCSLSQSSKEMRGDEVCQAQSMARE